MGVALVRTKAGLGLVTTRERAKDEHIIEYTGDRISDEEADRRGGKYLFTVDKTLVIDGKNRQHLARYLNHSCRPNCYAEIDEDTRRVHIRAKRRISAGEELTYHYGKEYFESHIEPHGCRCETCMGSQNTRR